MNDCTLERVGGGSVTRGSVHVDRSGTEGARIAESPIRTSPALVKPALSYVETHSRSNQGRIDPRNNVCSGGLRAPNVKCMYPFPVARRISVVYFSVSRLRGVACIGLCRFLLLYPTTAVVLYNTVVHWSVHSWRGLKP